MTDLKSDDCLSRVTHLIRRWDRFAKANGLRWHSIGLFQSADQFVNVYPDQCTSFFVIAGKPALEVLAHTLVKSNHDIHGAVSGV
jgi:hypothetical protein